MKLQELKQNEKNPRGITDLKLGKLKKSIQTFEKMMALRPLIVDENNLIISGNQRYRALVELGYTEIKDEWVKQVKNFTEKEKKELLIKDNLAFGEWDWLALKDDWDLGELTDWGLDTPFEGGLFNKILEEKEEEETNEVKVIVIWDDEKLWEKFKKYTGIDTEKKDLKKEDMKNWKK